MRKLERLLSNNQAWAQAVKSRDPAFFERLSSQQAPKYLWIGCSDSRVPANEICGLMPGEMFVHRNVANLVNHTDLNCLSVLQFAVEVLHVRDIVVCGHYGCGGVRAAMQPGSMGLIDHWLLNIKDVYDQNKDELESIEDPTQRTDRLCELNVRAQVQHLCHTVTVQEAWRDGSELNVHGFIYGVGDGLLKDLEVGVERDAQIPRIYRMSRLPSVPVDR